MTLGFPYSRDYSPTAPVLEVVFVSSEFAISSKPVIATVDTGADGTFVPVKLLERIQAPVGKVRRARSLWGEWQSFPTFLVDVRLGDVTFPGIEVVGYDGDELVLGRDVLNKMRLLLDGPAQTTEILEPKQKRK